jgi:tripeptide aminopeptidase
MDLVRIDSPSLEEGAIVQALSAELEGMGMAVTNDGTGHDGVGNLIATLPGTDPAAAQVMLSMHFDTVEPGRGIKPRVEDGIVRSDGTTILASDNKAAIAAALEALRCLQATRPAHGDVELLLTWGEERSLNGSRAVDPSLLRAKICFAPDADGPVGTIVTRAPFQNSVRATFIGKAAHAGVEPEKGISAIVAASKAIAAMPLGRLDHETTANIGLISGGTARNAVPERAEIVGEARSLSEEKLERQTAAMRQAIEAGAAAVGARVEIAVKREYDGFIVGEEEAPVQIASAAARALGLTPRLAGTGGGSDANNLNRKGVRSVVLGVGCHDVHSTREHIAVADLALLAQYLVSVVVEAGKQKRA